MGKQFEGFYFRWRFWTNHARTDRQVRWAGGLLVGGLVGGDGGGGMSA